MVNKNVALLELPQTMSRLHDALNVDVLRHYVSSLGRFVDRPLCKVSHLAIGTMPPHNKRKKHARSFKRKIDGIPLLAEEKHQPPNKTAKQRRN
ncbi:hypothetical protein L914_11704 [Phytophthora nicotianae]|uniref:Uncharacterized protein n=1 Tax=Phytophthora nicotianae TaxID=4792 RepID=W2N4Q3_PHYNI|nr:hypothetical protein L914_11704 [Phytophthora nicotianae]